MGSLRIVAGRLRGRKIPLPVDPGFRPTADRVREALFSILADRIQGSQVLDAYSGSGAIGLEAWSRGAERVLSVESDPDRAKALASLHESWGLTTGLDVVQAKVLHWLKHPGTPRGWDLILADPPFGGGEAAGLVRRIAADPELLAPAGLLVVERNASGMLKKDRIGGLQKKQSRRYGTVFLDIWSRIPPNEFDSTAHCG